MKPTEIKAKQKAKELISIFSNKELALECCEQVLETVRQIKGLSKVSKIKLWGLVKESIKEI